MFTPMDASVLFCRRMDTLRAALALTPDYLETREGGAVHNLMDTGIALGRRFRALKLWMVMRVFGAEGLRARLREHIRLAREFAQWVEADPEFELMAPVALSLVCFRAVPRGLDEAALDALNEEILEGVNATGEAYLSHTRLRGRYVLRLAVGHIRTAQSHVARTWALVRETLGAKGLPNRSR
jgi:aromatic-L-amino-acid decarboxylase